MTARRDPRLGRPSPSDLYTLRTDLYALPPTTRLAPLPPKAEAGRLLRRLRWVR